MVANDNDLLEFEHFFGEANGRFNFTIDIWGALNGRNDRDSSVIFPGQAIYNCEHGTGEAYDNNNIAVRCTAARKLL